MGQQTFIPSSVDELIEQVKSGTPIIPRGGGTKPSLWKTEEPTPLIDTRSLNGIVEYQPSEYTVTVQAGTPLKDVITALAENGQYLPFDPPLANQGATIGGTVAAGLSGPGAYRYGPIKDFIIGVRFVDGQGNYVRGGGKVVKNAAGFDFPKLFNGSIGRLGVLTEVSFKVFPEPQNYVTLQCSCENHQDALKILPNLIGYDLEGVEIDGNCNLLLRLGYQEATMDGRKAGLESIVGRPLSMQIGESERDAWQSIKNFDWAPPENSLFKTATHPVSASRLLDTLNQDAWQTHLTNGGKTVYLCTETEDEIPNLSDALSQCGLTGLQIRGHHLAGPLIGKCSQLTFINRIQKALDPDHHFLPFEPTAKEVSG